MPGKTTLFNCLLGMLRPEGGTVVFDGEEISGLPVYKRARLGFGRTFQRLELFAGTTVRDHFLVAERQRNGSGRLWKDLLNLSNPTGDEHAKVDAMIELLGLQREADQPVESLSLGRGRLVELGRALDDAAEAAAARRAVVGARRQGDRGARRAARAPCSSSTSSRCCSSSTTSRWCRAS